MRNFAQNNIGLHTPLSKLALHERSHSLVITAWYLTLFNLQHRDIFRSLECSGSNF